MAAKGDFDGTFHIFRLPGDGRDPNQWQNFKPLFLLLGNFNVTDLETYCRPVSFFRRTEKSERGRVSLLSMDTHTRDGWQEVTDGVR